MSAVGSRPIARGRSAEVFADGDDRVVKLAFPGIDATTLDAQPARITASARRFTASELVEEPVRGETAQAEIGAVRDRIDAPITPERH